MPLTDDIRQAVLDSGLSKYRISQDTGIPFSVLSVFMAGGGRASGETLDKLCEYLGLEIRKGRRK